MALSKMEDKRLPANPYAEGGVLVNKLPQIDKCQYYASFEYAIDAAGANATITPLTGNLSGDLRYYRVEIKDGVNVATETLDLAAKTTPFVVNTSILNPNISWDIEFYGEDGAQIGDVGCSLRYVHKVVTPKSATGNTIPPVSKWDNVQYTIKLDSTTDVDYVFPEEGVVLGRNSVINLQDYSTNNNLVVGEAYNFELYASKIGLSPSIAIPVADPVDLITITGEVTFPFALSNENVKIASLVAATGAAGTFTGSMSSVLTNEGVTPSISITINSVVV